MARVFIEADSLDTVELRAALAALSRVKNAADADMPTSIAGQDGNGRAFVGLNGPDKWSLKTIALFPNQAIRIAEAIAQASYGTADG